MSYIDKHVGRAAAVMLAAGLCAFAAGCSEPQSADGTAAEGAADPSAISVRNDSVVLGDLEHYQVEVESAAEEGTSLSFDEESNLQQEKTAGFTGGAVVSNLEELGEGIDDWADEPAVGQYATTGEPPALADIDLDAPLPASHVANGITEAQCATCHH